MGLDILLKKENGYYGEDRKCILLIAGIHGNEAAIQEQHPIKQGLK